MEGIKTVNPLQSWIDEAVEIRRYHAFDFHWLTADFHRMPLLFTPSNREVL